MTGIRWVDEHPHGVGWIASEPAFMQRASHALVHDGRVYVVDPVDGPGVEERIRALGAPAAVVQLLDRHSRDCAALAVRLDVPHLVLPDSVEGARLRMISVVRRRLWREMALWWPEPRILVVAEAVGAPGYFRAPGERLGVHPMLRLLPPRRALSGLAPEHLLLGHGEGLHGPGAAVALREALRTSRRRIAPWLMGLPASRRR